MLRKLFSKICFVIIFFIFISNSALSKEKIILAADKWCPYNCEPNSNFPGFMVELATIIFAKHNIEIEYVLKPWDKALEEVKHGKIHGILGANLDEAINLIYPTLPQAYGIMAAYTLDNINWKYENINSLKGMKLGLTLGYKYPDDIANFIFKTLPQSPESFIFVGGEDAIQDNINNLIDNKITVYLENESVISNYLQSNNTLKIRFAGQVRTDNEGLYIAFSPKLKKSHIYARFINEGMDELRNSGKLAELYKKYKLNNIPIN